MRPPLLAQRISLPRGVFLLCAISLYLVVGRAIAGDWPQWRGLTQDGVAQGEDLAESWPHDGPTVMWARELGQGYSAFTVVGDRAFTQTQSLYEQSLVCLDANTGETLWSHSYGWPYDGGGLYPGPRATPAVADGRVYIVAPNGLLGCVDAMTGKSIWSDNLKERFQGRGTDFGVAASPVVWRGRVIVPVGGRDASLVAVDARSGKLVWKCGQRPASYATPMVVPFEDRWLVLAPLENSLLCADADTGELLWELNHSVGYDERSAALLYREPFLMIAQPFRGGATCYRLVVDTETQAYRADRVWDSSAMSNDIASSVLVGDFVYGFDLKDVQSRRNRPSRGSFRCLDWKTGETQWSSEEPGHANIIVAEDKLLLFNDRGELKLCRASPDAYETLASTAVFDDEICWTPPALSNGRVFLRTQTRAACLLVGRSARPIEGPAQTVATIPAIRRFDPTVVLGGEREFPAATPEWSTVRYSFSWTVLPIALAWAAATTIVAVIGFCFRRRVGSPTGERTGPPLQRIRNGLFWGIVFAWGASGSAIVNTRQEEFLFTWPVVLWGLNQLTTESSVKAVMRRGNRWDGWRARGMILLFVSGCGVYFHLCRQLGLAAEWSFLSGFVVSCPLAMGMAWCARKESVAWQRAKAINYVISYSVYFWTSVCIMKWSMPIGT